MPIANCYLPIADIAMRGTSQVRLVINPRKGPSKDGQNRELLAARRGGQELPENVNSQCYNVVKELENNLSQLNRLFSLLVRKCSE